MFLRLYVSSLKELSVKVLDRERDSSLQGNSRKERIKLYEAAYPHEKKEFSAIFDFQKVDGAGERMICEI